eukprot:scaffold12445_cov115-Cylindrotheca_fusiformis.AAC.1
MESAEDQCRKARLLWLKASTIQDLDQVEHLYRNALNSKQSSIQNRGHPPKKKKQKTKEYAELSAKDYRQAGVWLSLLYCQSGRAQKAKKGLEYLGFVCRLASQVLDYPLKTSNKRSRNKKHHFSQSLPLCVMYDNFLNDSELNHLKAIFGDPDACYWSSHNYQVEPPSPYFSYVFPLKSKHRGGFVDDLVRKIWKLPELNDKFPELKRAKFVEMWAHNRPHASGHQMHFDSDDEGRGSIRNPIVSTILYITADGGGPSLVTNQRLGSTSLADKGWLSHPKTKRLVAFDGRVLHGVVPGKGLPLYKGGRRVTLMFAFWKNIETRDQPTPGSARPFPRRSKAKWAQDLVDSSTPVRSTVSEDFEEKRPIELDVVYETLDGRAWKPADGMIDYEQVFQGF